MMMLAQTVLPFKLEATEERLTTNAGLVLFGEFARGLGIGRWIDETLPAPGSGRGYVASRYVTPLVLMVTGGGRALEDLREIAEDRGFSHLLTDVNVPSTDAVGDWLRRMGAGAGLCELGKVCDRVTGVVLRRGERTDHTLDIDASQIVAEKQEAKWTYKGEVGYMPMVGHLAEAGIVLADEFREGNAAPASNNLEFVRACVERMPRGHRIARLRADSASYQAALFNWCEAEDVEFAIGARHDEATERAIAEIPAEAWKQYADCAIAETVHSMNETKKAFRLIVVKRQTQGELFDETKIRYTLIASNRREGAEATYAWYCQRGQASENGIKELKCGFGMERMPCGQFAANAMFFRIGVLAHNLFVLFKQVTLEKNWQRHQVQTVRWKLLHTAGKVIRHAGAWVLKVHADVVERFRAIRSASFRFVQSLAP